MYLTKSMRDAISEMNAGCAQATLYGLRAVIPALQQHGEELMATEFTRLLRESQRVSDKLSAALIEATNKSPNKRATKR